MLVDRSTPSDKLDVFASVGYHVSAKGSVLEAWTRAKELGCRIFQVFSSPPRQWSLPTVDLDKLAEAGKFLSGEGASVVLHAPYLVNLASTETDLRRKSADSIAYGLQVCRALGAVGLVVHAGTAKDGNVRAALVRTRKALQSVARRVSGGRIIWELTAGAGNPIAALPHSLPALLDAVGDLFDAGICLDTQHLWAAGFDWRGDGIDRLLEQVETACGLQRLACIHLNDSKSDLGSRSDRHANIGKGSIGQRAFVELLLRDELSRVPKILETPGSSEIRKKELKSLQRSCLQVLRRASAGGARAPSGSAETSRLPRAF